jgi:hemoglobin/transferrin/lactoferrin receptor protein
MRRCVWMCVCVLMMCVLAAPLRAATVAGRVTDATGAGVPGARVVLKDQATGKEEAVETNADGRYELSAASAGSFLLIVTRQGFAEAARTIVVKSPEERLAADVRLEIGPLGTDVSVTAARSEREIRQVPLHVDTMTAAAISQSNALSTGDALSSIANVTPVGNGPFGVRPRLRGLDSTRLLVLVDGERLNTARQATDRTGAEVGLVSPETISRAEIVNGAGTLMYGSDALSGTINIITSEPSLTPQRSFTYGLTSFYSTNEDGGRASLRAGYSSARVALQVQGGLEQFGNYQAGKFGVEDTNPLFASGQLHRGDTIDDNFGFTFKAFPDPFNAPFVRTSGEIPNSGGDGYFVNANGVVKLTERSRLRMRYQHRRANEIGFPDFAEPYFFNATSLPQSDFDRASVRYETQALSARLASLSVTGYVQRTNRVLQNHLPVQFPAPTPTVFFPIAVMRLDIESETGQRVWTPGVDVQAVWTPGSSHLLTTGATFYRDQSHDERTTVTTTSMVGQVVMGQRGPAAVVFPSLVPLGPPSTAHPVRVPDASLADLAFFAQDEWRVRKDVSVVAGLRGDFYRVVTEATPGYSVDPVVAGAVPPIDPATLPDPAGSHYNRQALTGDVGLILNADGRFNPFVRVGRSFRHPNLEEMLFAGPATIGSIAPNVLVEPETGINFDAGLKFRTSHVTGGVYGFTNWYSNFIAQDLVVATTPAGPLAQATNYADVRIAGVEASGDAPIAVRYGVFTLSGSAAFLRGTIVEGTDPLTGASLAGTPADNITPLRVLANVRFTDIGGRWWAEYGMRAQTDVTRVAQAMLESPFLIAQDLLSLNGFDVHRIGGGMELGRGRQRVALTYAVENLTNRFYREHFQFAPARGRSFTVGLTFGGAQ